MLPVPQVGRTSRSCNRSGSPSCTMSPHCKRSLVIIALKMFEQWIFLCKTQCAKCKMRHEEHKKSVWFGDRAHRDLNGKERDGCCLCDTCFSVCGDAVLQLQPPAHGAGRHEHPGCRAQVSTTRVVFPCGRLNSNRDKMAILKFC